MTTNWPRIAFSAVRPTLNELPKFRKTTPQPPHFSPEILYLLPQVLKFSFNRPRRVHQQILYRGFDGGRFTNCGREWWGFSSQDRTAHFTVNQTSMMRKSSSPVTRPSANEPPSKRQWLGRKESGVGLSNQLMILEAKASPPTAPTPLVTASI